MTKLIIIRHGETEANVRKIWQGSTDAPLTDRGQRQVAATAQRLADLQEKCALDAFYVSPLPRAQTTAAAIADSIGLQAAVEDGLREFDLGAWEGRSYVDLRDTEDLWGRWAVDPDFAPPRGESPSSFHTRAVAVLERISRRHPDHSVLIVTHGALICNVLATWLGAGPQDWRQWEVHNCALSVVRRRAGVWRPVLFNDVSHLPAGAIEMGGETAY